MNLDKNQGNLFLYLFKRVWSQKSSCFSRLADKPTKEFGSELNRLSQPWWLSHSCCIHVSSRKKRQALQTHRTVLFRKLCWKGAFQKQVVQSWSFTTSWQNTTTIYIQNQGLDHGKCSHEDSRASASSSTVMLNEYMEYYLLGYWGRKA